MTEWLTRLPGVGVFQAYYEANQLRNYTSQEVAWIPSLEAFMMFVGGLWVGRVYGRFIPKLGSPSENCDHLTRTKIYQTTTVPVSSFFWGPSSTSSG